MARTGIIAIAGCLITAAAAWGDLPPPPPQKLVEPRVRFEGVENYPAYVFCLRYSTFDGGPADVIHTVIQLKDSKPFQLNAKRGLLAMQLLAMERKEFEKRFKVDPSLKWLNDKTEGVLSAELALPSPTAPANVKDAPITTYRVVLEDGQLIVEMIEGEKASAAAPFGLLPTWAFGIFASLSIGWLGICVARRGSAAKGARS